MMIMRVSKIELTDVIFTCTSKKTTLSKKRPLRVRHMAGVLGLFVKSTALGRSGERPNRLSKLQQKADRGQLEDL